MCVCVCVGGPYVRQRRRGSRKDASTACTCEEGHRSCPTGQCASGFSYLRSIPLFNINGFAGKDSCRLPKVESSGFYESRNQFFFDVIKDHWKKLIYQLINVWGWDSKWCEVQLRFRTSKNIAKVFQDGEEVIVHSGDLKNLRGLVTKAVFGSLANKAFLLVQATKGFFLQKMQFWVQMWLKLLQKKCESLLILKLNDLCPPSIM